MSATIDANSSMQTVSFRTISKHSLCSICVCVCMYVCIYVCGFGALKGIFRCFGFQAAGLLFFLGAGLRVERVLRRSLIFWPMGEFSMRVRTAPSWYMSTELMKSLRAWLLASSAAPSWQCLKGSTSRHDSLKRGSRDRF